MTPTNDARQLQAEARPLMTATLLAQQDLSKARQQVLDIETKLGEVSAAAARTAGECARALSELDHKRNGLLAHQALGVDVQAELKAIEQQITEWTTRQTANERPAGTRRGLLQLLAKAKLELSDASKAERKQRNALITLLEEQEAAAWELIDLAHIKHAVTIQALAQLRGAQGLDGLEQNGIEMPKASVWKNTPIVRLDASALEARVREEVRRIASSLEKRGILVAPAAIARLQSPSTKEYRAVEPLRHDGQEYAPGDPITLPDVQARPLLESRTIVERAAKTTPEPMPQAA